jgi:hypothetical protein
MTNKKVTPEQYRESARKLGDILNRAKIRAEPHGHRLPRKHEANVYGPGEEPPPDGRERFWGKGAIPVLIAVLVTAFLAWTGIPQWFGRVFADIVVRPFM